MRHHRKPSQNLILKEKASEPTFIMQTIKNAASYVNEPAQQSGSIASKEANKEVAKDNNSSLSSR
jgi:hypothetical protein